MYCPNCGSQNPDGAAVCISCGEPLSAPSPKVILSKDPAPVAPAAPETLATPVTPVTPAAPAGRKVSPKSIVSMVLGLIGLGFATVAPIYAILSLGLAGSASSYARSYSYSYYDYSSVEVGIAAIGIVAIIFAVIGIGLSIPALILSGKGRNEGYAPANHGISKCGKVTGIITLILCGISLVLSFIGLMVVV